MKIHKIELRTLKAIIRKINKGERKVYYITLNDGDILKIQDKTIKDKSLYLKLLERGFNL